MPSAANAISDEAIDWIVRLNSGDATAADAEAFRLWRGQGIEHEMAALEAETIWYGVAAVGPPLLAARERRRRAITRRTALGLGAVTLTGAALYASGTFRSLTSDYVTGVGERREVALADGSVVRLNALSAMSVELGATNRRLWLHEGQASFTVAHDPSRPFIVEAAGGQTRAVGTVFDVDHRVEGVVVTVIEGLVDVTDGSTPLRLAANQQVRYDGSGAGLVVAPVDAALATAWQRGRLVFEDRRLDSVVSELGRYGSGLVVIANPELSRLRVSGVFDLDDPASVLDSIAATLPVEITRLPYVTVLR